MLEEPYKVFVVSFEFAQGISFALFFILCLKIDAKDPAIARRSTEPEIVKTSPLMPKRHVDNTDEGAERAAWR